MRPRGLLVWAYGPPPRLPMQVAMLVRHPAAAAVVALATLATALFFAVARPQYRAHHGREISFAGFPAPDDAAGSAGWRWSGGPPGFRFGRDERDWNVSELRPADLAPAVSAAARTGVVGGSVRPLNAMRLAPSRTMLVAAGSDARSRTCLGFVTAAGAAAWRCPPRLGPQVGFVVVAAGAPVAHSYPFFLLGAARGDVDRVTISQPGFSQAYYERSGGNWGTFSASLAGVRRSKAPWQATLRFYGRRGVLATLRLRLARPADELVAVPAR